MKVKIERGVGHNGVAFCIWSVGTQQGEGDFYTAGEYSALVGYPLLNVQEAEGKTEIKYGEQKKIFDFPQRISFAMATMAEIEDGLLLRKKEITRLWNLKFKN